MHCKALILWRRRLAQVTAWSGSSAALFGNAVSMVCACGIGEWLGTSWLSECKPVMQVMNLGFRVITEVCQYVYAVLTV